MLHATRDLRQVALWLGHESTQTTELYLQADPMEKLKVLHMLDGPALKPGKFRVPARLLATLKSATIMRPPANAGP